MQLLPRKPKGTPLPQEHPNSSVYMQPNRGRGCHPSLRPETAENYALDGNVFIIPNLSRKSWIGLNLPESVSKESGTGGLEV